VRVSKECAQILLGPAFERGTVANHSDSRHAKKR
jgi:hypothetical protein